MDYCEVIWFENASFKERRSFSSPKARMIYHQTVEKFSKPDTKDRVLVALRNKNHDLIACWSNLTESDVGNRIEDFKKRKWKPPGEK